jgi:ubiquinone/menaquinone biosynthesis C-methylase UbiE
MEPRTRWSEVSGGPGAATAYQRRFDDLAAKGMDIHGEAAFVSSLVPPPVRVLDAGCGTGRAACSCGRRRSSSRYWRATSSRC